jgi:hypothetical protein
MHSMSRRRAVVAAMVGVLAIVACGDSNDDAPAASGPDPFGATTLKRVTKSGTPTPSAEVWLDLVAEREDLGYVNVAIDLDAKGTFADYDTPAGVQSEWLVRNQVIRVAERRTILDVDLVDPGLAVDPPRRVRIVLSAEPIDESTPWTGEAPAGSAVLERSLPLVAEEAIVVEGSPGTLAGGGGRATAVDIALRPSGDPTVPPDGPKYEDLPLDQKKVKMPSVKQEDGINDCVGHSIGSGLAYLARRCPLKKPIAGFDVGIGAKESSILGLSHAVIDTYKKAGFFVDGKGGGVQSEKVLAGKQKFIADNSLEGDIETTRVPADPTDFSGAGVWNALRDALKKKTCAIEVGTQIFDKYGQQQLKYGHMMVITGIKTLGGKTTLDLLDSLKQETASNPDEPHRTKEQPVTFPANGAPTLANFKLGGEPFRATLAFVLVECCKNPLSCAPPHDGSYNVRETGRTDPAGHYEFIGNPFASPVSVASSGGTLAVNGNAPFVNVSGTIDDACTFHGTGSGTVAGRPNVSVKMDAEVTENGFSGTYVMGAGGELPQGQPLTLSFEATPL